MMAAYAEGLAILKEANIGNNAAIVEAETTPLTPKSTSMTLTSRKSPRCGAGEVCLPRGRWTSQQPLESPTPTERSLAAESQTRVKAVGPSRPASTKDFLRRYLQRPCMSGSARAAVGTSPTTSCLRCVTNSGATLKNLLASSSSV